MLSSNSGGRVKIETIIMARELGPSETFAEKIIDSNSFNSNSVQDCVSLTSHGYLLMRVDKDIWRNPASAVHRPSPNGKGEETPSAAAVFEL
jgi:hypothetical protein